jgi:type II secretory pathway pseudopilin PulG
MIRRLVHRGRATGPPRIRRTRGGERGLTLVDLLAGLAIAMVVLGGVLTTISSTTKLRRVDDELALAFVACRTQLEELRNAPFNTLAGMHGTRFSVRVAGSAVGELRAAPGVPPDQPGLISVTVYATSGSEVVYRVRASVTWSGVSGVRTFSMETLITNRRS